METRIGPLTGSTTSFPDGAPPLPPAPVDPLDILAPVGDATSPFVKGAADSGAIDVNDVIQGPMGDCYLVGSLAALAKANPNVILDMVHPNRDAVGNVASYTVDLYSRTGPLNQLTKTPVTVDATQFSRLAARSSDTDSAGRHEIWTKVIEKAYANLKGGYSKIGNGGNPGAALEALTGLPARECAPRAYSFDQLQKDLGEGRPVCFSTVPEKDAGPLLAALNLHGSHCYAVVDSKVEGGKQMVRLSNPWGDRQPGASKSGWVPYDELMKGRVAFVDVGADRSSIELRDAIDDYRRFYRL
jgi:hypothetical protein